MLRVFSALGDDFRANAFVREYLQKETVRDPAVHNMRLPDTALNSTHTGLDLGKHPPPDYAFIDEFQDFEFVKR